MPTDSEIRPQPGPQSAFNATKADIAIGGGGAGGGKTWGLLWESLRHIDKKGFGAVIFRREYPQITSRLLKNSLFLAECNGFSVYPLGVE